MRGKTRPNEHRSAEGNLFEVGCSNTSWAIFASCVHVFLRECWMALSDVSWLFRSALHGLAMGARRLL
jgi:hypothetical protein